MSTTTDNAIALTGEQYEQAWTDLANGPRRANGAVTVEQLKLWAARQLGMDGVESSYTPEQHLGAIALTADRLDEAVETITLGAPQMTYEDADEVSGILASQAALKAGLPDMRVPRHRDPIRAEVSAQLSAPTPEQQAKIDSTDPQLILSQKKAQYGTTELLSNEEYSNSLELTAETPKQALDRLYDKLDELTLSNRKPKQGTAASREHHCGNAQCGGDCGYDATDHDQPGKGGADAVLARWHAHQGNDKPQSGNRVHAGRR